MSQRRTRGRGAYGLIKARYIKNRSGKTGNPITGDVKRVVYYNVYGDKRKNPTLEPRGSIYDSTSQPIRYGAYKDWAVTGAVQQTYTYRLIISPKGKQLLLDTDFVTAVRATHAQQKLSSDFRLVVHRDTAHAHAHLLFHTDKTMGKQQLETYKEQLRLQLMALEESRAKAKGVSVPKVGTEDDTNKSQSPKTQPPSVAGSAAPAKPRRRRRRRSQSHKKSKSQGLDL